MSKVDLLRNLCRPPVPRKCPLPSRFRDLRNRCAYPFHPNDRRSFTGKSHSLPVVPPVGSRLTAASPLILVFSRLFPAVLFQIFLVLLLFFDFVFPPLSLLTEERLPPSLPFTQSPLSFFGLLLFLRTPSEGTAMIPVLSNGRHFLYFDRSFILPLLIPIPPLPPRTKN